MNVEKIVLISAKNIKLYNNTMKQQLFTCYIVMFIHTIL